jgi:hypothetical protein
MAEFDPAKEAINLSKHGISLSRWTDLEVFAIVGDDRFNYGESPVSRLWCHQWCVSVSSSPFVTDDTVRSACDAHMQRK